MLLNGGHLIGGGGVLVKLVDTCHIKGSLSKLLSSIKLQNSPNSNMKPFIISSSVVRANQYRILGEKGGQTASSSRVLSSLAYSGGDSRI